MTALAAHRDRLLRVAGVVLALGAYQTYALLRPAYVAPGLPAVWAAFREQLRQGLLEALAGTLVTVAVGFLAAAAVGVVVGVAMGVDDRVWTVLDPYLSAMYVAPLAALVPLLLLVGGGSFATRALVVFLFAVVEVTVTTARGVDEQSGDLAAVARSFGAGRWFRLRHVVLPAALPSIFTGLRLGVGRAVKGVVLAELLVEFTNLGAVVQNWSDDFRIAGVFSVVVLLMLLGYGLTRAIQALADHLLAWRPEVAA